MNREIFSKSEKFKEEYSCRITRIGPCYKIEKSKYLAYTLIGGESIVIRRDEIHENDIVLYVTRECVLPHEFLSKSNLYMFDIRGYNSNYSEVQKLVDEAEALAATDKEAAEEKMNEAKRSCGYFGSKRRVRIAKLQGVVSNGFLFSPEELITWKPELKSFFDSINLEDYEGTFFDTVDGELFCYPYVPKKNTPRYLGSKRDKNSKRNKKLKRFDRIIPDHFSFHYTTQKLGDNIWRIKPDDIIVVSNKLHGTSLCAGNVLTNIPLQIPFYKKWWNKLMDSTTFTKRFRVKDSYVDYGNVYSSRTVIKNEYINKEVTAGFYKVDIWGEYNELLKDYIPQGWTLYGEIFGYLTGSDSMIQKQYDYGCEPGTNKLMIYRISQEMPDGSKYEWNVSDVREWTDKLMEEHPEFADRLHPIDILYHGTLADLYPELDQSNHWHENVLLALKNDKKTFGMELDESLCKNKVPREGIVIRIDNDECVEAFKLKTDKFFIREAKQMDAGDVSDIEMQEADYQEDTSDSVEDNNN